MISDSVESMSLQVIFSLNHLITDVVHTVYLNKVEGQPTANEWHGSQVLHPKETFEVAGKIPTTKNVFIIRSYGR